MNNEVIIQPLKFEHIADIVKAFADISWHKPYSLFAAYFTEAQNCQRNIWVASINKLFAGYVTLKWQSEYQSFYANNIPEIADLNILPIMRKQAIGSKLMAHAEKAAAVKSDVVGIGVGLYGGYGNAEVCKAWLYT